MNTEPSCLCPKGQDKTFIGHTLLCFSFLTREFCQGGRQTKKGEQVKLRSSLNPGICLTYRNNWSLFLKAEVWTSDPLEISSYRFYDSSGEQNAREFLAKELQTCSSVPWNGNRCCREIRSVFKSFGALRTRFTKGLQVSSGHDFSELLIGSCTL